MLLSPSFRCIAVDLWAADDPHFGPMWAEQLREDIPGVVDLERLADTGHLFMEEHPHVVADRIAHFLGAPASELASRTESHR